MKRFSNSLVTREIQIKSTMYMFPRVNTIEKSENVQYYWQGYGEMELSYTSY